MASKYKISLIIPFYNSIEKCEELLESIAGVPSTVEVIFIDDGSIDKTYDRLLDFKENYPEKPIKLIYQANKGPGGARNTGIRISSGDYLWFVDSDDRIRLEIIEWFLRNEKPEFDVYEFGVLVNGRPDFIDRDFNGEVYCNLQSKLRLHLLESFGYFFGKLFKKNIFTENNVYYPEYCYYEDVGLRLMLPFFVRSLFKVDVVGYEHTYTKGSITKSEFNFKHLDNMSTTLYGYQFAANHASINELFLLQTIFIKCCLYKYLPKLISGPWGFHPVMAIKYLKKFRENSKNNNMGTNIKLETNWGGRFKLFYKAIWVLSFFMPSQKHYFDKIRLRCWGRVSVEPDI